MTWLENRWLMPVWQKGLVVAVKVLLNIRLVIGRRLLWLCARTVVLDQALAVLWVTPMVPITLTKTAASANFLATAPHPLPLAKTAVTVIHLAIATLSKSLTRPLEMEAALASQVAQILTWPLEMEAALASGLATARSAMTVSLMITVTVVPHNNSIQIPHKCSSLQRLRLRLRPAGFMITVTFAKTPNAVGNGKCLVRQACQNCIGSTQ